MNNFTMLRLAACIVVIWDHSYRLVGQLPPFTGSVGFTDVGTLAVYSFFAISGYLLLGSWMASPKLFVFALKRALRIMPAVIVAVLMCAFVFGLLATTMPVGEYLHSTVTSTYVLQNLWLFNPHYTLPGVFGHQSLNTVNGSIWTLCYEVTCYLVVPVFGLLLLRRWRWFGTAALVGIAALPWDRILPAAVPHLSGLNTAQLAIFGRFFLVGALMFAHRDRIPLRWPVFGAVAMAFLFGLGHWWGAWIAYLAIPYFVVYLAQLRIPVLSRLCKKRDISYGMYLYAFPVQQVIVDRAGGSLPPLLLLTITIPATACLAVMSWHAIEEPAMRLKGVITGLRLPRLLLPRPNLAHRPRALVLAGTSGAFAGLLSAMLIGLPGHFGEPVAALSASAIGRSASSQGNTTAHEGKPVLIFLHGLNESPLHPVLPALLAYAKADGYTVLFTEEGGPDSWGDQAAVNSIFALKQEYSPNRPVRLLGVSMGTATLVNFVAEAPPGTVSSAVGVLPISHLPTDPADVVTEVRAAANQPAQYIGIPYQMWYGTADTYAGYPATHGPHVSLVPMPGAKHALPIPYNIPAIFHFLDTDGQAF